VLLVNGDTKILAFGRNRHGGLTREIKTRR
jgi:hypothetical protein